ncbi:exonuclease Kem1, putative [Rhizophagus clarus]|uniref:5'-3' exoribonuclease 1 n=1 Tax=Rhizophagus clarus TaxID=94130 RepID=A0A8H3MEH7_9GLOM|nr:exonuclease Kem1, putative [Rhizophagus clarus]
MGIPKFFRWMSERYPLCSQLITENRIPEFDNLYLDMNGIIHNCSHSNDTDVHNVSEDKIFLEIFNYIDHLFTKIKPKQLFFMAVDGVAPRAKMNQQRARRFRTAAEAAKKAESRGEESPQEAPFDSNCITPGTEFMAKLSRQLKYFINKKVSEDSNWRDIKIVLSGHEVPGEGEHKIMEYIRNTKAQEDYNPNVRHCLYGLDADLVMLGLLSHDPHFALLREEVTFGSSRKKKQGRVESQNFYLMHLSLLREYLDLEFSILKDTLPFEYNLERIIDDFILLALFIGNDFLPHLPNLHIAEGALGLMFQVYKKVLPDAGGYINDGGILEMKRLEMIFKELTIFERDVYEGEFVDLKWFKGKQKRNLEMMEEKKRVEKLVLTPKQREIYNKIKKLVKARTGSIHFPADYPARDRVFIKNLAKALKIHQSVLEDGENGENKHLYVECDFEEESSEGTSEMREEVYEKYETAEIIEEDDIETYEEKERKKDEGAFIEWKKKYYMEKMQIDYDDPESMDKIVSSYVEGLQWVLWYYYFGVASWGWFYPYHYSPKISDLYELERFDILFDKDDSPFTPFEQLMGVLPEGSKRFLPKAYQDLLSDPNSPIIDFYPREFTTDMNGKKQEWEAIVNIPFIDQRRLIAALKDRKDQLTEEEKERDTFGDIYVFTYDPDHKEPYPSSLPGFFPDIHYCLCHTEVYHVPTLEGPIVKGLCDGVQLGVKAMAGFPSLQTLQHTAKLLHHGVNVFNSESKNETMVISIVDQFKDMNTIDIVHEKVGKRIFIGWPFLQEGKVQAISDEQFRYELSHNGQITSIPHKSDVADQWRRKADKFEQVNSKRFGTIIGKVNVLAHVLVLKGLKQMQDGALVRDFVEEEQDCAIQTTVDSVECEDSSYYGCPGAVSSNTEENLAVRLIIDKNNVNETEFGSEIAKTFAARIRYSPSYSVAKRLNISGLTLSKLTASLHVICKSNSNEQKSTDQRINLGLNLKFEAKKQKVLGYTRKTKTKDKDGWEYSEKAIQILAEYKEKFPEFIQALENKHDKDEIYTAEDFYPKEEAVSKIHAIKDWLKTVEVRDFEKVPLEAEQLDKEAIQDIEEAANELLENKDTDQVEKEKLARHKLLKPSHASTLLQNQKFNLGDRVVFVKDSGNVPIASKGTIVGIEKNNIDVVFDCTFMGGSTLGDRCSNYRGMTVPANSLLNLTRPQLPDRRLNTGNGRSRHGTNFNNHQTRYQEALQNGQQTHYNSNAYPYYYNNGYSSRGRGWPAIVSNGSHQRSNRPRGVSGSNGYIQSQLHARPISQSQASSGATKYNVQNQTHHTYRNPRSSNMNGYLPSRGNGSRVHFGGNGVSRGRGRGDGKT